MELNEWFKWYDRIRARFGYSIVEDQIAARILSKLAKTIPIEHLESLIHNKDILVVGAGPSLEDFKYYNLLKGFTIISCDGATQALLENDVIPHIVVTDLDGDHNSLIKASNLGSIMVVHAHGDNINLILNLVPKFKRCIATTQVKPLENVYNFGGFTDGDRAVFLASQFKAKSITLLGMDLGEKIGKYSKSKVNTAIKIEKMKIAKELLEYLSSHTTSDLYNLSNSIIKGYKNIDINYLINIK